MGLLLSWTKCMWATRRQGWYVPNDTGLIFWIQLTNTSTSPNELLVASWSFLVIRLNGMLVPTTLLKILLKKIPGVEFIDLCGFASHSIVELYFLTKFGTATYLVTNNRQRCFIITRYWTYMKMRMKTYCNARSAGPIWDRILLGTIICCIFLLKFFPSVRPMAGNDTVIFLGLISLW